jgi:hypothetical protein
MPSNYTFKNKGDFLVMTIKGDYHYWEFIKYPKIIRKKCEEWNNYKVLVDLILVTYKEIPTIELFFLGEILADTLRDKIKMALVWTGKDQKLFLQAVANNRAACLRIFEITKTAEYWLLYDREDEPLDLYKA